MVMNRELIARFAVQTKKPRSRQALRSLAEWLMPSDQAPTLTAILEFEDGQIAVLRRGRGDDVTLAADS